MEFIRVNIKKIRVPDIDASLKYGQIFASKTWKNLFIFAYVLLG